MSSGPDYILPGHRDRIGDWPVAKLMSALEDMLYDNEHGFLPPSIAETVDHLSKELFRRESGAEEASEARRSDLGRQLDTWFPATSASLPALRGDLGADATAPMRDRFFERAAPILNELDAQRDRFAALEPANDRDDQLGIAMGFETGIEPEF